MDSSVGRDVWIGMRRDEDVKTLASILHYLSLDLHICSIDSNTLSGCPSSIPCAPTYRGCTFPIPVRRGSSVP